MMKKDIKLFLKSELIGSFVEAPLIRLKGKIIDESKHRFLILCEDKKIKNLLKNQLLIFTLNDQTISIDGKLLNMRPEERVKIK